MGGPPKDMNEGFPKEESGGGRGAKRVVGLGTWERIVSSLVTSLGEGRLLADLGAVSLLRSRVKTTWQSVACDGAAGEGTGMMLGWRWVVMLRGATRDGRACADESQRSKYLQHNLVAEEDICMAELAY